MNSDFLLPKPVLCFLLNIVVFFLLKYWLYWLLPENSSMSSVSSMLVGYGFHCRLSLWLQDVSTLSSVGVYGHVNYLTSVSLATGRGSLSKQTDGLKWSSSHRREQLAFSGRHNSIIALARGSAHSLQQAGGQSCAGDGAGACRFWHIPRGTSPTSLSPTLFFLLFYLSVCVCVSE